MKTAGKIELVTIGKNGIQNTRIINLPTKEFESKNDAESHALYRMVSRIQSRLTNK